MNVPLGDMIAGCITKTTYSLVMIIDEAIFRWRAYMHMFARSCSEPLAIRKYAELLNMPICGKAVIGAKGGSAFCLFRMEKPLTQIMNKINCW